MRKSLKLSIMFRECIVDALFVKNNAENFFNELLETVFKSHNLDLSKPLSVKFDPSYVNDIYEIEVSLECTPAQKYRDIFAKILLDWCNPEKNELSHLWLRLSNPAVLENDGKLFHSDVRIKKIAFGTLPDMQHFMQHKHYDSNSDESKIISTFLHSEQKFIVYTCFKHVESCSKRKYFSYFHTKFCFFYKSLLYVVVNYLPHSDEVEVFFHTEHFPHLYFARNKGDEETILANHQEYEKKQWKWNRAVYLSCKCKELHCTIETIGRYPVFKMVIPNKLKACDIIERLIKRCPASTLFYFANIKSEYSTENTEQIRNEFELFPFNENLEQMCPDARSDIKFKCQFAWNTVNSRSLAVRDQIILKHETGLSTDHWKKLQTQLQSYLRKDVDDLCESLYDISQMIFKIFMFTFEDALERLFQYHHENKNHDGLPNGMHLVRRIVICPSRITYIPPSEHFENRVIRKFGTENLLRVSIQDDDSSSLNFAAKNNQRGNKSQTANREDFISKIVKPPLLEGIHIGPRKYEMLASSCSQLRSHGLWMYAKDHEGNTAQSIRESLGDFRGIKNVAKYMARVGQSFSASDEADNINLEEEDILRIKEIETDDGKYIFSDGVGMISKDLVKKLQDQFAKRTYPKYVSKEDVYDPSAFQIRFKGCKGMLAESRTLEENKIAIRPSMEKFPCNTSKALEILKVSAPRPVCLNRPLITILENLGIDKEVFIDLQKKMVFNLIDSLLYERKAQKILESSTSLEFPFEKLSNGGISLTQEPFFRSLLLTIFKSSIKKIRTKANIEIPPEFGRIMMGVIDETRTLKEDQIFAQYSEKVGLIKSPTKPLTGPLIVTSNPCMHPGDVRKVTAVDVPELRHRKDCIVFPAIGKRPLPDQMAGSDLDGDEFILIWDPKLIFSKENEIPLEYPANEEKEVEGDIQVEDMVEFFCRYIRDVNIGVMASAHLVLADYHKDGVHCKACESIAKKYPKALDFAKSGTTCSLSFEERPIHYPDFLEKGFKNNSYKSTKSLGVLYRMIRNLEASVSTIDSRPSVQLDMQLEFPGWKKFEGLARKRRQQYVNRIKKILNKYELQNEAEVLTGCLSIINDYNNYKYDNDNFASLTRKYLTDTIKRYRLKFEEDCESVSGVVSKRKVQYMMASAWYMVTYQDQESSILSFPWVVSDILCGIKILNCGRKMKILKSASIKKMDQSLFSLYQSIDDRKEFPGICNCCSVMYWVIMKWMKSSSLLSGEASCINCFEKIIENFQNRKKCCSFSKNNCSCIYFCLPMKLILDFFKYYACETSADVIICEVHRDTSNTFFKDSKAANLQSVALKTYATLAITQNLQYLGITGTNEDDAHSDSYEEGEPIRIRVTKELEEIINGNVDKICDILKEFTGVKEIMMHSNSDEKDFFILVRSIGNPFQRWNLEELILDEKKFLSFIKSKM